MRSIVAFTLLLALAVAYPAEHSESADSPRIQPRILGGKVAQIGRFPYQARFLITKRRLGKLVDSLCGGSLISNKVILTAAHCIDGALSGSLLLGSTNINSNEPTRITMKLPKESFIMHEDWNMKEWNNDIALVILPEPIQFNSAVKTVNLPRASQTDLENRIGIISGFGLIGNSAAPSDNLLFVERKILKARYCEGAYSKKFKSTSYLCVDGSFIKSACQGDSGGPLVINEEDGSTTLVGVTSLGSASCEMGYPTVYTKVTSYLEWIQKHTGIEINK